MKHLEFLMMQLNIDCYILLYLQFCIIITVIIGRSSFGYIEGGSAFQDMKTTTEITDNDVCQKNLKASDIFIYRFIFICMFLYIKCMSVCKHDQLRDFTENCGMQHVSRRRANYYLIIGFTIFFFLRYYIVFLYQFCSYCNS